MRWLQFAIGGALLAGCQGAHAPARPVAALSTTSSAEASIPPASGSPERGIIATGTDCGETVAVFEAGTERGRVCAVVAASRGLTVVDLSDDWTPAVLARAPDGQVPEYHATYVAIANEQLRGDTEPEDALGELYGVTPALAVVRARIADTARHTCWAAIDPAPITALTHAWSQDDKQRVHVGELRRTELAAQLERARKLRGLPDLDALDAVPAIAPLLARWRALDAQHAGLVATQQKLACEDGFDPHEKKDGELTWRTGNSVELFQRRNFLMPNQRLDAETRDALALDSRELDFRMALRILRERVVDATGLIEDGSAGAGPQPVLGRMLDPAAMRAARGHLPMPGAALDLVDAATEAAATALGWTDPDALAGFLAAHPGGFSVAIALPAPPADHSPHMELAAEIDRGDVWYDELPRSHTVKHRPTLILYAIDGDQRRPLVRWPTTIGGWADVRMPGGDVVQKWKESDVGPRVWKELYAGPTWTPPPTTPDRDLAKNLWNGHWALKTQIFGPGAHSAYGLVMLIHHQPIKKAGVIVRYDDNGIRTHGSSTVTSIVNGTSHGCHRLYNQLAVRLGGFLLHHRDHVVRGEQPIAYRRVVRYKGEFVANVDSKGFLYELTPPVPVTVLKGRILSPRKIPPKNSAPARP